MPCLSDVRSFFSFVLLAVAYRHCLDGCSQERWMISLGWNVVGGLHFLRVKAPLDSSLSFYFLLSPVLRHVFPQLYSVGVSLVAWMVKNLPANAGDPSLIPGWGRSPGGGNGNPLQYSCLENPMDRGTWRARVHRLQRVGHD